MHGFQLWANLPSSLKMTAPRYQDVKATDVPVTVEDDGTEVRIVCGHYRGEARTGPRYRGEAGLSRHLDPGKEAEGAAGPRPWKDERMFRCRP